MIIATMSNKQNTWTTRAVTGAIWALAGMVLVYWVMQTTQRASDAPVPVATADTVAQPDMQAVARALGAQAAGAVVVRSAAVPAPSRLVLVGVLAGQRSGGGAALIAMDGQPPRPYRVGAVVHDGLVLQSLSPRVARLGSALDAPVAMTLEMPLQK